MAVQEVLGTGSGFIAARRVHGSLTAAAEKRALLWMAARMPRWVSSDHLTILGFAAQIAAGIGYAMARYNRYALLLVIGCMVLNWFGDSMDGTLARVRKQPRPRFGFYVDHMIDVFGSVALMGGLAMSGLVHWQVAVAMLVAFLLLSSESFLATYTLSRFELSQGLFGPTELRILLIAGNFALLRSAYATVFGHTVLLFDLGGVIASICMAVLVAVLAMRHTAELYRAEPLP
jgi:phosphatidylglycerophosphate synthase